MLGAAVIALIVPSGALAAFPGHQPRRERPGQHAERPGFDHCEPDDEAGQPTCTNVFGEQYERFGFAPNGSQMTALYHNPLDPHVQRLLGAEHARRPQPARPGPGRLGRPRLEVLDRRPERAGRDPRHRHPLGATARCARRSRSTGGELPLPAARARARCAPTTATATAPSTSTTTRTTRACRPRLADTTTSRAPDAIARRQRPDRRLQRLRPTPTATATSTTSPAGTSSTTTTTPTTPRATRAPTTTAPAAPRRPARRATTATAASASARRARSCRCGSGTRSSSTRTTSRRRRSTRPTTTSRSSRARSAGCSTRASRATPSSTRTAHGVVPRDRLVGPEHRRPQHPDRSTTRRCRCRARSPTCTGSAQDPPAAVHRLLQRPRRAARTQRPDRDLVPQLGHDPVRRPRAHRDAGRDRLGGHRPGVGRRRAVISLRRASRASALRAERDQAAAHDDRRGRRRPRTPPASACPTRRSSAGTSTSATACPTSASRWSGSTRARSRRRR